MNDKRYPTRMHEVLGVEPDKEYTFENGVTQFNFYVDTKGHAFNADKSEGDYLCEYYLTKLINHPERITRRPRLTEEAQEKEDHIIRLERMRSQKDQWANGKHAHWLETPADHAKDRDALDAAIEALAGKSRLTEPPGEEVEG